MRWRTNSATTPRPECSEPHPAQEVTFDPRRLSQWPIVGSRSRHNDVTVPNEPVVIEGLHHLIEVAGPRELVHGERESFIAKYRRQNTWLLVGSPATSAGAGGCSRGACGDEAERMADGIHRDTAPRAAVLSSCWAD